MPTTLGVCFEIVIQTASSSFNLIHLSIVYVFTSYTYNLLTPTPYSKQVNIRLAVFESRSCTEIIDIFGIHSSIVGRYVKKFLKTDKACKGVHPVVPPILTRKYIGLLVLKGDRQTARGKFLRLMELGLSMSYITAVNILKKKNVHAKLQKKQLLLTIKYI